MAPFSRVVSEPYSTLREVQEDAAHPKELAIFQRPNFFQPFGVFE